MKKIDMHFHTKASDWTRDNNDVLRESREKWIDFIASTDHDIINDDLVIDARVNWMKSVAWVEISALDDKATGKSLHLTCYSDNFREDIRSILENTREKRKLKIKKQIDKLESNWFKINYEKFIRFYKNADVNIDNLNNSNIAEYVFQNEDKLDKLLLKLVWTNVNKDDFIQKILKRTWEFREIGWEEIEPYEPTVEKIWSISRLNNYFLSLAHPNFTFKNDIEWFLKFIEEYQDKLNWLEINSKASEEWTKLIVDTSVKYWLILTFWSDSHYNWEDSRHWDLWDMNKYVDEELVEEHFEDFLYELSKK